jgi:hypothetical protein
MLNAMPVDISPSVQISSQISVSNEENQTLDVEIVEKRAITDSSSGARGGFFPTLLMVGHN